MKAAIYRNHGPARDVLHVEDVPSPKPGPGEVRVRIRVSGVNPTDWKARRGRGTPLDVGFQVPNQDGAGDIDEVGPGVDPSRRGERVWVYNAAYRRSWGTAAEYCIVPGAQAIRLPESVGYEIGASLGIPAMTAHRALFADGSIEAEWVLVAGGAGAVGHHAIALARWGGARVIATVSSESKGQLAKAAGADHVINYRQPEAANAILQLVPAGVNRIIEVAPLANAELDVKVLAPNGTIVIYASDAEEWTIEPWVLMYKNTTLRFILVYEMPEDAKQTAVNDITSALAADAVPAMRFIPFPLERIADAHDAVEAAAVGKVIVEVS